MFRSLFLFTVLLAGLASCDRPQCENQNPIFDSYTPNSSTYKLELAEQLKTIDQSKLTYWLQKYEQQDDQEYLFFHVQGEGLCAILVLTMIHWDQLERIREKQGVGSRGAEFVQLSYDIQQDGDGTTFYYQSYERIID